MGVYEDKLGRVIALGENVWIAEYRFAGNADANGAAMAVAHHVPGLVELARSGKADMVVADFSDHSRLFFGGLLADDLVASAHRAVLAFGGTFDIARQPPDSALILTRLGVEEGRAPGLLVAEMVDPPTAQPGAPLTDQTREVAKPWWKLWG